jgi:hypothetical protein
LANPDDRVSGRRCFAIIQRRGSRAWDPTPA